MMKAAVIFCFAALLPGLPAAEVPGYERLRAAGGNWEPEAGSILFSELSCAACHQEGAPPIPTLEWKAGPDLSAVGDRLRAAWIRTYLADPGSIKPGTTMPHLLAGMEEKPKAEQIENLTHYLMSLRSKKKSTTEPVVGSAKSGRTVFFSTGCVACHGKKPMAGLEGKYAPGALARFLIAPLTVRPAGRMPDQKVGKKDAAHLAAYLAPNEPAQEPLFAVDGERAAQGRKAFMALGCVACHGKEPPRKTLRIVDLQQGCLAPEPKAGVPQYALTGEQRDALRTALSAPAARKDPQQLIRRIMLQRNCFACHQRDGVGGPAADIAEHFTSAKDDLGDLGRLPPPLDGVGRKFQRAALENILRGNDRVRSYMRVKMPGFEPEFAHELSQLFATADADSMNLSATANKNPEHAGTSDWGRELVGIKGYACIVCHDINGQKSLGIGAYDLAEMPKRLRPEWMREFLLNPGTFPTGTRMPLFWPGGTPMNPAIGGGTTERQMDSILRYLAKVDESLPPEGMAAHAAQILVPADKPIIFRTFMKSVGTHAIAVGFPGGVNVAFDALAARWSMAWRGKFLDADTTWNQRYVKMEQPLGEHLGRLEDTGTLAIVGQENLMAQFRGYHVGKDGVPVFEYDLGALRIEDRAEPTASCGLKRTLQVSGQTSEVMRLSARPPAGVKVQLANGAALPATLEFHQGKAEIVEEIAW